MNTITNILVLGIILISLSGCEKETEEVDYLVDIYEKDKYYDSEIFTDTYLDFYGKWNLYCISGGLWGGGYAPNFDYLKIKEYGIYGFIRNDSVLEFGKIIIEEQTDESLLIIFEADDNSETFIGDNEKYVNLNGSDSLNLNSPCCDRYNYHYVRKD